MLVARETIERDMPRVSTSFSVGETVMVNNLGRVGNIVGRDGSKWLVRLTEGDAPVSCDATNLSRRKTLLG